MKSTLTTETIEVVTYENVPRIQVELSIEEAWVVYNLCQHIGGVPVSSARRVLSDLDDLGLSAVLEMQLAQHYNVTRDQVSSAQFNAENPFHLTGAIDYGPSKINDAVKLIESKLGPSR